MVAETRDLADAVAHNALFRGIDIVDLRQIASQMQTTTINPGQVIIHSGDTDDDVYFLLCGTVIGQLVAETGKEVIFTEMHPGAYFGELAALDGSARSVTISAKDEAVLARLSGSQFNAILRAHAAVAVNLSRELAARIRRMNERVFGLVVHDVGTRVRLHLMRLAQEQGKLTNGSVLQPAPTHEEIAMFIGANREAVSRAMTKLNKEGLIESSRQSILIKDCDSLLDVAD